jgi:hypothetical protein
MIAVRRKISAYVLQKREFIIVSRRWKKGSPAPNAAGLSTLILPMLSSLFLSGYAS